MPSSASPTLAVDLCPASSASTGHIDSCEVRGVSGRDDKSFGQIYGNEGGETGTATAPETKSVWSVRDDLEMSSPYLLSGISMGSCASFSLHDAVREYCLVVSVLP